MLNNFSKKATKLQFMYPFIAVTVFLTWFYYSVTLFLGDTLGHDYSYFLPLLLDGKVWFESNGLWAPPWFTPSVCGGLPRMANPQGMYYSLPQFFAFVLSPLQSLISTWFLLLLFSFSGFYLFAKRILILSTPVALLGAFMFLSSGFLNYRYAIGHLTYHSYAFTPFLLFFLTQPKYPSHSLFKVIPSALIIAYLFYSGLGNFMPPLLLSVLAVICLLYGLKIRPLGFLKSDLVTFSLALLGGVLMASPYLYSSLTFLNQFPRDFYSIPTGADLGSTFTILFHSLFFDPQQASQLVGNSKWQLAQHEFEFGIGLSVLFLLSLGFFFTLKNLRANTQHPLSKIQILFLTLFTFILSLPLLLNLPDYGQHELLKSLPVLKSTSNYFRWIGLLPLPLIILGILFAQELLKKRVYGKVLFILVCLITILQVFIKDRRFYLQQNYNPLINNEASIRLSTGEWQPEIVAIGISGSPGQFQRGLNDSFVFGHSYALCYEPIFGYRLEALPFKQMQPGPIFQEGSINIKNPACYVFPKENNCEPGDHFSMNQLEEAKKFVEYKPFEFNKPMGWSIAVAISWTCFAFAFFVILKMLIISFGKSRDRSQDN